jgi:hypothetical protein
MNFLYNYNHYD